MKAVTVGAGVVVALCALGGILPAQAEGASQVATSTGGAYAWGALETTFPDGIPRAIAVLMAVPSGTVAGSPAVTDVDLTRPWVALRISSPGNPPGLTTSGECATAANPASWGAGHAEGRSFTGMHATLTCPGDPTYSSYTIRFQPATEWGRTATTFQFRRPELNAETWGWSAPNGVNGTLVAEVKAVQTSHMRLCGKRHDGRVDCYGGKHGMANVYPAAGAMTAELHTAKIS